MGALIFLQVIAETIPLDIVDPTCVHADVPDTLNDIFMYRLVDRQQATPAAINPNSSSGNDSSTVVVFKCSNNEAKLLVDSIRTATGKPLKHVKRLHHVDMNDFYLNMNPLTF